MSDTRGPSSQGLTIALAIAGAVIFSGLGRAGGFLAGALIGGLLAQVLHLRARMNALGARLDALQQRGVQDTDTEPVPAQLEVRPDIAPVSVAQPAAQFPAAGELPVERAAEPPAPPQPETPAAIAPRGPSAFERRLAGAIAWARGGNPLARIGIVVLFFGGAFLARYAAEHSLFPIELRFALIALGAVALLFLGWRLRTRRPVYAEILQGGGIAGLYLTLFAATRFELLPLGLALGLMIAVALAGAVLAVAQNALSLAVIGTAGGFLAPILVSTGGGNHIALFTYYALLNLGVFAVAWFRTWRALNVLGFLFTFTITGLWRAGAYHDTDLVSTDAFLILYFLMYVGVSVLNAIRQPPNLKGYVSGSLVFGLPVVAFGLHASLVYHIQYALAWSALGLGAFYVALAFTLYHLRRETFRLLVEAFAALGVIFASLAIPLAFDSRTTAAMWAVEGAGLVWLGVRQARKLPRAFGTLLQLAAAGGYVLAAQHATVPVLNGAFIGAVLIALGGFGSGYWLQRSRAGAAPYERGADVAFALWATAWWLFAGLHEIDLFLGQAALGAGLVFIAATSIALGYLGRLAGWRIAGQIALYLPAVGALGGLGQLTTLAHPFAEFGAIGWPALLAAHFAALRAQDADIAAAPLASTPAGAQGPGGTAASWLHAGAVWLIALLVAREASYHIYAHTVGVWGWLPHGLVPAALLAWLGRRQPAPPWPVARHARAYRLQGGVPLAVALCGWVLIGNLTQDGAAGWLPYVPLANPLDISVALAFVALALWWTALQPTITLHKSELKALAGAATLLVFVWLNAALLRALHHLAGTPLFEPGMWRSTLVQASLSIFWGVLGFAAMATAARKHWRIAWLAGAGLMVVVVVKLFLVDLSSSGTLARIASFLTVGALLLVTGYLAPLPPRRAQEAVAP